MVLLLLAVSGCTINLVRKPAGPELVKEQIAYFKWLYEKGFGRSDPELMRRAAFKLLEISQKEPAEPASQPDVLEKALHHLEDEIERIKEKK